jgi:ribosomal protein S18 acetylase RimI-like enzyme
MPVFQIRPTNDNDRSFIRVLITRRWKAEAVVVHGEIFYPAELPGFIAQQEFEILGLITYKISDVRCEIITLDSLKEGQGIGTQLIDAVKVKAIETCCSRVGVITTNDNLPALGFYQKHGFKIKAIAVDAVESSRLLKPSIPQTGFQGIPIRDEIELEMSLSK